LRLTVYSHNVVARLFTRLAMVAVFAAIGRSCSYALRLPAGHKWVFMPPFDPIRRIRILSAAFGALIMLASTGASAQPIPVPTLPLVAWPGLSQDDVDRMHAAAARLYEGRSIGTVERWRSPDSKIAGEVKLVRSFETHGMPCRTIDYTVRFQPGSDALNHYVANWCRVAGDAWKIVELARPR
jgi:hypothetical protein